MNFFRFEDPWLLVLLALLPYLAWRARAPRTAAVLHFSSLDTLKTVRPPHTDWLAAIPWILRTLGMGLLILALARPQEGHTLREIVTPGVDIVLSLDTSGSMRALDFKKEGRRFERLGVVKEVVAEFVKAREHDRIGMVVFGEEAFTQCPLTLDHDILLSFLDRLEVGMAGDSTAIGSAIGIAVKRLKDLPSQSRVLILLTDGRNNAGALTPMQAAEIAETYGIKIYTIGVGTRGKAPFLVDTVFGKQYVYQDVEIDEKTLREIAKKTGGRYFRATDLESLQEIYDQIDQLEKSEVKTIDHSEYRELYRYFLIPGLGVILLEIVLSHTRLRRVP